MKESAKEYLSSINVDITIEFDEIEKEDIEGMDSCFHFPHYILSGNEVICWNEGGKLTEAFFVDLKK